MTEKILKLKVGEVFADGENIPIFKTFRRKVSKKGVVYYEATEQIFIHEISPKAEKVR